jgi:hypothetical protein
VINKSQLINDLAETPQLNAELAQMSELELKQLLCNIEALQIELSRFAPLLIETELNVVVIETQYFLKILTDEINSIFAVEQTKENQGPLQNWDNEGGRVEYPQYQSCSVILG